MIYSILQCCHIVARMRNGQLHGKREQKLLVGFGIHDLRADFIDRLEDARWTPPSTSEE